MTAKAAFFLCLFLGSASAFAQGNMTASGAFTPGHTVRCQDPSCTVVTDAGGAGGVQQAGQGLTEFSVTNTGLTNCVYDAPVSGPNHRLCSGANVNGGGALFSYDAQGGATPLPWQIEKDGSFYPFPPTGNGNIMGPNSSTIGHIVVFNNIGGTLVADSTVPLAVGSLTTAITTAGAGLPIKANGTNNATAIYDMAGGGFTTFDAIQGAVTQTAGTTGITATNGIGGYVLNQQAASGGAPNAVALFGAAITGVNGGNTWGLNTLVTDYANVSESGAGGNRLIQDEIDANGNHTDTTVNALVVNGLLRAQQTNAWGIVLNTVIQGVESTGHFTKGFYVVDGATTGVGIEIGRMHYNLANQDSQEFVLDYSDGGNVPHNYSILASHTTGTMQFGSSLPTNTASYTFNGSIIGLSNLTVSGAITAGGSLSIPTSTGILINGHSALFADAGTSLTLGSDASYANLTIGNGTVATLINGGLQIGTPTGGNKGLGTLNVAGALWTNGVQAIGAQTCTVNQAKTLIFSNGLLTGGTCNT